MFPGKSMKDVTRGVRNLPDNPAVDPTAPDSDADDAGKGMTCPSCGAAFSLQAVAAPASTPPPPAPAAAESGAPVRPSSGDAPSF